MNVYLENFGSASFTIEDSIVDPCGISKYLTADDKKILIGSDTQAKHIVTNKIHDILRNNIKTPQGQECSIDSNTPPNIMWPDAKITQTVELMAVVKIVNVIYDSAYNPLDFTAPPRPPPLTTPPPTEGAPVWIFVVVFIVLLLIIGTTIILSQ